MLIDLIMLAVLASGAAVAGGALGHWQEFHPRWMDTELRHAVIAFGGGALVAAVSLVLVPRGLDLQPLWLSLASFAAGAAGFMSCDRYFARRRTPMSQLLAMMLDFVPEAIVVGAIITKSYREAVFIAVIIAAQNLPEAFNAYREITHGVDGRPPRRRALLLITAAAATGPLWALIGYYLFESDSTALGALMTFCAGGIFYLVFRDVAPQANLDKHWYPPFGAVLGFMVGMGGHALV